MTVTEPVFSRREISVGAWIVGVCSAAVLAGALLLGGQGGPARMLSVSQPATSAGVADAQPISDAG